MSAGASISLERLAYDPSGPTGPTVGAHLLAGTDGDQLSSTNTGSKEALDVNIAASDIDLTVDLDLDDLVSDDEPDTEDPLKVGSRSADQGSVLAAISAAGDKANAISDLYRRIWVTHAPNVGWSSSSGTTDATPNTAAQVDSSKQAGRQYWMFQNQANNSIYLGEDNTVTTSTGIEVGKGSSLVMEMGEALDVYSVAGSASQAYRFIQVG